MVISLVDIMEKMELQRIAKYFKVPLTQHMAPTDEEVAHAVGMRVTALLEARFRQLNGLERERMKRFEPLVQSIAEDPEQRHLLTLLLDDCYQKSLNPTAFLPAGTPRKESGGCSTAPQAPYRAGGAGRGPRKTVLAEKAADAKASPSPRKANAKAAAALRGANVLPTNLPTDSGADCVNSLSRLSARYDGRGAGKLLRHTGKYGFCPGARAPGHTETHFRQRKRAIRELRAMGIGLWRLGLKRSFPSDGEFLFERFMLGLYEQAHTNKEREQANAFDLLVRSYIDKFGERGDTDFTTVSGHIVSLFRRKPGDTAAQRLKLALLMRNTYTDIFRHLI